MASRFIMGLFRRIESLVGWAKAAPISRLGRMRNSAFAHAVRSHGSIYRVGKIEDDFAHPTGWVGFICNMLEHHCFFGPMLSEEISIT